MTSIDVDRPTMQAHTVALLDIRNVFALPNAEELAFRRSPDGRAVLAARPPFCAAQRVS